MFSLVVGPTGETACKYREIAATMRSFSASVQGPVAMLARLTLVSMAVIGTSSAGVGMAPLVWESEKTARR